MTKKSFVSAMIGVVALYSVPVAPAFAAELSAGEGPPSFQALSGLPDERRIELAAMTDEQLDAVEGAAFFCALCIKAVWFRHLNASVIKAVWIRHVKASVHKQGVHRNAVKIWQVNVSTKSHNTTHQSNTALVFQRH